MPPSALSRTSARASVRRSTATPGAEVEEEEEVELEEVVLLEREVVLFEEALLGEGELLLLLALLLEALRRAVRLSSPPRSPPPGLTLLRLRLMLAGLMAGPGPPESRTGLRSPPGNEVFISTAAGERQRLKDRKRGRGWREREREKKRKRE